MSFKDYVKEMEDLEITQAEDDRKAKIADFIRTIEDLNDEKFHSFAIDELGMDENEAEVVVYKMLRDFLLSGDKDEDGIPDDLLGGDEDEVEVDGDEEGFEDEGEVEAEL